MLLCPWNSPVKNTRVGSHSLLQEEIFLTQRSNLSLLHCRQICSCLSHQGRPKYNDKNVQCCSLADLSVLCFNFLFCTSASPTLLSHVHLPSSFSLTLIYSSSRPTILTGPQLLSSLHSWGLQLLSYLFCFGFLAMKSGISYGMQVVSSPTRE